MRALLKLPPLVKLSGQVNHSLALTGSPSGLQSSLTLPFPLSFTAYYTA